MFAFKKVITQLEKSVTKGRSQKADDSPNPDTESVVAKLNSEIARVKAENASQHDVFSRKIDEMARTNGETLSKYTAQISIPHAEVLRLQAGWKTNLRLVPLRMCSPRIPKGKRRWLLRPGRCRLVRHMPSSVPSNGWTKGFPVSLKESINPMRASSGRPSEEPARGRSVTRRNVERSSPEEPDDGDDDSDDSEHT